jgi:hypothetical protein
LTGQFQHLCGRFLLTADPFLRFTPLPSFFLSPSICSRKRLLSELLLLNSFYQRMSVVLDRVNALKHQLDALSTAHIQSLPSEAAPAPPPSTSSLYLTQLHNSVSRLSSATHTKPSLDQISRLLIEVNKAKISEPETITQTNYARELEWLFLARCTIDTYGCLLEQLFQQNTAVSKRHLLLG